MGKMWFATHDDGFRSCGYAYTACKCDYSGSTIPSSYPAPDDLLTDEQRARLDEDGYLKDETCPNC